VHEAGDGSFDITYSFHDSKRGGVFGEREDYRKAVEEVGVS
jgi:hypothetical protein